MPGDHCCLDCGAQLSRPGARGPWPVRCPEDARARSKTLQAERERLDRGNRNRRNRERRAAGYRPPYLDTDDHKRRAYLYWRSWVERHPEEARALAVAGSARRRARLAGCTEIEYFTSEEIFERDDWVCHICEMPTSGQHPESMSPSIDHVIALANEGQHTRANVRTAHLVCNLKKGAR